MTSDDTGYEGFLVEFTPVGSSVKVCAVDPLTGLEAIIVGSALTPPSTLADLAVRKLRASLGQGVSESETPEETKPDFRRGILA